MLLPCQSALTREVVPSAATSLQDLNYISSATSKSWTVMHTSAMMMLAQLAAKASADYQQMMYTCY